MIGSVSTRLALAAALTLSIPAAGAAQDVTPEDVEWHLTQYVGDGGPQAVPWFVDATLRLQDGDVTGSAGCNGFFGTYQLEGDSLSFGQLGSTLMACADPILAVEDGYLAALSDVTGWTTATVGEYRSLHLRNTDGEEVLHFETPALGLTRSDIRALERELETLQSQIDRHEERIDDIRIGVLRDRIKTLEAAVAESATVDLSTFTDAERVLLGGVRKDIAEACEPRRSQNPTGTIAALQCHPDAPEVADMAYYLMEQEDAGKVWDLRMKEHEVKDGTQNRTCAFGKPSSMYWVGGGLTVAGCYRNEDGRASLRFVQPAAECRQLTAGDRQVKDPSIYVAVLGPDKDIGSLWEWAASSTEWEHGEDLFDPITQAGQPWSNQCPH